MHGFIEMNFKLREQQKCVYPSRKQREIRFQGGFRNTYRHDQHTAIPGERICEIRFFCLRTLV